MFYLALLFIISGILIFVYSVFHKSIEGDGSVRRKLAFFTKKKVPANDGYFLEGPEDKEKARVPEHIFTDDKESQEVIVRELSGNRAGKSSDLNEKKDEAVYHDKSGDTSIIADEDILISDSYAAENLGDDAHGKSHGGIQEKMPDMKNEAPPAQEEKTDTKASNEFVLYDDSSSVINYGSHTGFIDPTLEEYRKISRIGRGALLLDRDGVNFYLGKKLFRFDFYKTKEVVTGSNFIALFIRGSETVKLFIADKENDIINMVKGKFSDFEKLNLRA